MLDDIIKNLTWKDIILIVLTISVLYQFYRLNYIERMSDNNSDDIRNVVKEVYQVDVQAIKNLGDLSKQILDNNGTLTLPYKVKIEGGLEVNDNLTINEGESNDMLQIRSNDEHYLYYNKQKGLGMWATSGKPTKNITINAGDINSGKMKATGGVTTDGNVVAKGIIKATGNVETNGNLIVLDNEKGKVDVRSGMVNGVFLGGEGLIHGSKLKLTGGMANGVFLGTEGSISGKSLKVTGNIDAGGRIYAGSQIEGSSLKTRDVVFTAGGGWFRALDNSNNTILVNNKHNG